MKKPAFLVEVTGEFVPKPQFLFFQLVQPEIVGVGAMFFFVDERFQRGVLLFEGLDLSLIHRSHSFPSVGG